MIKKKKTAQKTVKKSFESHKRPKEANHKKTQIHPDLKKYNPEDYIYGVHAVQAALDNPKRRNKLLVVVQSKQAQYQHLAEENDKLKVISVTPEEIKQALPPSAVHQGVALIAAPLRIYDSPPTDRKVKNDVIIVLDRVTDPHNVGAVLRACAAFGCKTLIMQDRFAPPITGALAKAAAGGLEKVKIIKVTNIVQTLKVLKQRDYMVYGTSSGEEGIMLPQADFSARSVIVMGSEGEGIRRNIQSNCDGLITIPMSEQMESLNISVASGIILSHYYSSKLLYQAT
ncbi:MAG: 23S rRNA (guanosine(2251)-2'-O)-methyltransferase RlmB [Pseudomonadota bacterium]